MSRNNTLYQLTEWIEIVSKKMSHLSQPQAKILAMYSFGMAITSRSGRTSVAAFLAKLLNVKEENLDRRLRDWYCESRAKAGYQAENRCGREQLDITKCFAPLLRWILGNWKDRWLPLALDATTLRDRFTILSVSLVYRGNAIPIAWKILPGNQPHAWEPEWERLLALLKPAVSSQMLVLVLTDRGLYSPALFRKIRTLQWHPFMRINRAGSFRPRGQQVFQPLATLVAQRGQYWCGVGTAFQHTQVTATLLAFWAQNGKEPWYILTDLSPELAQACWYALRSWIEQSFRTIKRAGLLWHHSKMTKPERAERLWLPIALSMFWLMSVGTATDEHKIVATAAPADLPPTGLPTGQTLTQQRPLPPPPKRKLSVFRRGWLDTLTTLLSHRVVKFADLILGPLPTIVAIFDTT